MSTAEKHIVPVTGADVIEVVTLPTEPKILVVDNDSSVEVRVFEGSWVNPFTSQQPLQIVPAGSVVVLPVPQIQKSYTFAWKGATSPQSGEYVTFIVSSDLAYRDYSRVTSGGVVALSGNVGVTLQDGDDITLGKTDDPPAPGDGSVVGILKQVRGVLTQGIGDPDSGAPDLGDPASLIGLAKALHFLLHLMSEAVGTPYDRVNDGSSTAIAFLAEIVRVIYQGVGDPGDSSAPTGDGNVIALLKAIRDGLPSGSGSGAVDLIAAAVGEDWNPATPFGDGSVISLLKAVRDFVSVLGDPSNGEAATGDGTFIALLKRIRTQLDLQGNDYQRNTMLSGSVAVSTVAATLPNVSGREFLIQNSPSSTVNILIGNAANQNVEIQPGGAVVVSPTNLNLIRVKTASGTATLNYFGQA